MLRRFPWPFLCALLACGSSPMPSSWPQPRWIDPDAQVEPPPCVPRSPSDTVWSEADLDAPLQLEAVQVPKYPARLQMEGQAGHVEWGFVVTPAGRLDPCSLVLQYASHPAFVEPSRASFLSRHYAPPRRHGVAVFVSTTKTLRFRVGN
jgi:hypothetical protein